MKMKRFAALLLVLCLALGLCACGEKAGSAPAGETKTKWLRLAESFAYASLDAHKDYYGWYTSIYGMTETLFRVADDLSIRPLLASDYSVSEDGKT